MQWISTAAQMRALDRAAIEERGIPSTQLMETAARAVAEEAAVLAGAPGPALRACVFCGSGNNGGDGVAAARFLREMGLDVRCILVGRRENMTAETREMEDRLADAGGALEDFCPDDLELRAWVMGCRVLVDALFGIGLSRELAGPFAAAVALINASPAPTLAVDLPSGVETDTGRVLGTAVAATVTVTFTRAKPGHYLGEGGDLCGRVKVVPIGIPEALTESLPRQIKAVEPEDLTLPHRGRNTHKGDFGRIYILAGSVGYTGAPVLAARGALRSGAGLITLAVPEAIYPILAVKCDEIMPRPLDNSYHEILAQAAACDVVLMGPGLGRAPETQALVLSLLADLDGPVVLDADGLNAISGHIDKLDGRGAAGRLTVLTPHDGEFARLWGAPPGADRLGVALGFAKAHRCVLVLKGHRTITAFPDGEAVINTTGNPGMAKGGSGDVLAGGMASLLGQGLPPKRAVPTAVLLHGMAGDLAAAEQGEYGMTPTDLIEKLPQTMKKF